MKTILLLCGLGIVALAQPRVETTAVLVPSSATSVVSVTARLFQVTLNNKSGSTVYCSILDKQATPLPLYGDGANSSVGAIAAGTLVVMAFPFGRLMTSGITWSCSSATAVVGTLTYDQ